ncbi:substrate-binding domain-containing protein [Nostoc sp. UHCC 0302]|uniref:substrate-binding domain-containing protein n=1 Tax=Nostoc sp. UHCC 0302 TaxID=3134896 RepID=UPI00311CAE3A
MPSFESFYKEYPCSYNAPLSCDRPFQTAQQIKGAKFCLECGFPATLPQEAEIKGNQGTYQVGSFLGMRGLGRLYSGIQVKDKHPVIIKEYLLPNRSFNESETLKRKDSFKRVGGVSLADSRIQNFRLANTWEAIADEKGERCYLITKEIGASQTLGKYLIEKGAMTAAEVREVLNQALQTLQFLHTQKLRFPSNQIQQGLAHGNINLDSTLIQLENNQKFYIFFCDLAVWENLFIPPSIAQPAPATPEQDLESLGLVAFYLWVGRTTNYSSNQPLDYRDNQQWPDTDSHLKQFIYRLIGLSTPFENAEVARQALLQLPKEGDVNSSRSLSTTKETAKRFPTPLILLGILALLLLGGGILYYFWPWKKSPDNQLLIWSGLVRTFSEVDNVPPGKYIYTGEKDSTWSFILTQSVDNSSLKDVFNNPKPDAKATFNYATVISSDINNPIKSIEEVQAGKKDFAITSLAESITGKLDKKQVAYDGLFVFVAFDKTDSNLANALGGKITIDQLRKIFTGKITNWQQINPKLPNLTVRPFAPIEPEAIQKFQQIVLKNDPQDKALFEAKVQRIETSQTQVRIRKESEALNGQPLGIISFGILSKTWAQCAGYPLAIIDGGKPANQPLFQRRERRPITTSDDLCQHDDYFFDVTTFQSYPLGYPTFVVYPKDNNRPSGGSTFAEMLTTRQGQCLLSKVGLVALQPMPDDINSYACKSVP